MRKPEGQSFRRRSFQADKGVVDSRGVKLLLRTLCNESERLLPNSFVLADPSAFTFVPTVKRIAHSINVARVTGHF